MTLLALGNTLDNLDKVTGFVEHVATTSLCRFGLMVDRRDVLGPQEADVLFFEKYGVKQLVNARANLLRERNIRASYDSVEQHETWTPHLTLGYPATPAKPDKNDYGITYVRFDKIALWTGDYEGPEFLLEDYDSFISGGYETQMYMSENPTLEGVLKHFGVKGMKWGQRTARPASISRSQDYYNAQQHGNRGAERIRQRVAAGSDLKTARQAEVARNEKQTQAVAYGILATYAAVKLAPVIKNYTMHALQSAASKKVAAAGAKAAAEAFSNSRGIANYSTISLAFNGAKGLWE